MLKFKIFDGSYIDGKGYDKVETQLNEFFEDMEGVEIDQITQSEVVLEGNVSMTIVVAYR